MNVNKYKLNLSDLPQLKHLERPPKQLFYSGVPVKDWISQPKLAVVGSRKMSGYGAIVTDLLVNAAASADIVIISGLAYGVDAAAHKAALKSGGLSVAVLPTSLAKIYPSGHQNLANQICQNGGLITEYAPDDPIYKVNFTDRNRIIAGLADAILIPEAALKSGSLHTARYGLVTGKTVMAVPGNINSPTSEGANNLIKSGAVPVTTPEDIFLAMGIEVKSKSARKFIGPKTDQKIYNLISQGISDQEELALKAGLDGAAIGSILTGLEINGYIKPLGNGQWLLA